MSTFFTGVLGLGAVLTALALAMTTGSPLVILASAAVVLLVLAVGISVLESRQQARASRYSRPRRP